VHTRQCCSRCQSLDEEEDDPESDEDDEPESLVEDQPESDDDDQDEPESCPWWPW
jgi:hypothetical protein